MKGRIAQRASHLARSPLFADLTDDQRVMLAQAAHERRYLRGESVVRKGERPDNLILLASGKLKEACQSVEGDERIVDILLPGQTSGESSLLLGMPYATFITALVGSHLIHIERRAVLTLIPREPRFARRLMHRLSERILDVMQDIQHLSHYNPLQRVAVCLQENSREECRVIHLPVSKGVLASRLGITPEAFSRVLRDLSEAGIIRVQGNRIHILDMEKLAAFAPLAP